MVTGSEPHPSQDLIHVVMTRWRRRLAALGDWAQATSTTALDRFILRTLATGFADPADTVPRIQLTTDRFLLFFDGGSRGNPGPGGSGSVIVRARDSFEIIWMASMSFAGRTTTNNFAEFQGLCTGLQAAVRHQWHPLTVIGDSAMILSLMRRRKTPKAASLRPLFLLSRRAAASLRVTGWHHHYRVHNKMADKAANIAMDARRSFQAHAGDGRNEFSELRPLLDNDVAPWTEQLLVSHHTPDRPSPTTVS
jgi:ribonuclease HI